MHQDTRDEWASAAAAQIINLHLGSGDSAPIKFQKIASPISDVVRLAVMEERAKLLRPSNN